MNGMLDLWLGFGTLVVIFLLVIILGLEMKINTAARGIDEKLDKLLKK